MHSGACPALTIFCRHFPSNAQTLLCLPNTMLRLLGVSLDAMRWCCRLQNLATRQPLHTSRLTSSPRVWSHPAQCVRLLNGQGQIFAKLPACGSSAPASKCKQARCRWCFFSNSARKSGAARLALSSACTLCRRLCPSAEADAPVAAFPAVANEARRHGKCRIGLALGHLNPSQLVFRIKCPVHANSPRWTCGRAQCSTRPRHAFAVSELFRHHTVFFVQVLRPRVVPKPVVTAPKVSARNRHTGLVPQILTHDPVRLVVLAC